MSDTPPQLTDAPQPRAGGPRGKTAATFTLAFYLLVLVCVLSGGNFMSPRGSGRRPKGAVRTIVALLFCCNHAEQTHTHVPHNKSRVLSPCIHTGKDTRTHASTYQVRTHVYRAARMSASTRCSSCFSVTKRVERERKIQRNPNLVVTTDLSHDGVYRKEREHVRAGRRWTGHGEQKQKTQNEPNFTSRVASPSYSGGKPMSPSG